MTWLNGGQLSMIVFELRDRREFGEVIREYLEEGAKVVAVNARFSVILQPLF